MRPASEYELALSMMRLWGENASHSARNYAFDCCRKNDPTGFRKWHSVEVIIEEMQASRVSFEDACCFGGGTSCTGQEPVAIDRRANWFEAMAGMVMPALQRLGSAAIRGTRLEPS